MRLLRSMVIGAALLVSAPAHAERDRALVLFEESEAAYRAGRFQECIELLLEAKKLRAEPVLDYDLGRAYEASGHPREAADAFAAYLEAEPTARDRGAIEGRITTLRAQADALEKHVETPPPPAPLPPPPPPAVPERRHYGLPIFTASLGVAGLGAATALGVLAVHKHDDAGNNPVQSDAVDEQGSARSLARASTITFVAAGVVLAAGLAWLGWRLFR